MPTLASLLAARLGESAFDAVVTAVRIDAPEEEKRRIVADVLTAAAEYAGVTLPRKPLVINPNLTTKSFPGGLPALTTKGLEAFYANKGWRFLVLHAGPLVRSFRGQNERLQEMLALYEAQCADEGIDHVPAWADGPMVAGGTSGGSPFASMVEQAETGAR